MKTPTTPPDEPTTPALTNDARATQNPAPVAWEEFLEDDADCCGGCNHKPR